MVITLSSLPDVETERLRIRRLKPADAEAFRAMTNEPAILEAVHFLEHPLTLADAHHMIRGNADGRNYFWGASPSDKADLIGTVGTHLRDPDEIEIGYWFAAAAQGRGLASEAVGGVVSALANAFPDRRIIAECRPENAASSRLLDRIGFRSDGTAWFAARSQTVRARLSFLPGNDQPLFGGEHRLRTQLQAFAIEPGSGAGRPPITRPCMASARP